ncbi:hypothetical protein ILUMI_04000 [Ignelater luminosus]|uniref:RNA-directed DNA polymerase n=1 Tax=Ignelater luminosus TaxID=2038154 RepID=A0A8K0DDM9_IGNLU|nr:hypothetical protein ILUMI_04000 [Ignelater luminosus]
MTTSTVTLSNEQFQILLERIANPAPVSASAVISPPEMGNFSKCGSRFSGKTTEDVQAFIDAITVYKKCAQISDANALKGLPMLLDGLAAAWFQGANSLFQTWYEAIDGLKNAFGKKLLPHRISRDLFAREQRDDEPTDVFVSTSRALLAQLPETPVLDETHKLNMICGLLSSRIRKNIPRGQVTDFTKLIEKARAVEVNFAEDQECKQKQRPERPKCHYCHNFGHVQSECRKYANKAKSTEEKKEERTPGRPQIVCYGCRQPDHVPAVTSLEVLCLDTGEQIPRLLIKVDVVGLHGLAYVDSGARCSIAGNKLYQHLKTVGYATVPTQVTLVLADGVSQLVNAEKLRVPINVEGKLIETAFVAIPGHIQNKTLLGVDFITEANIIMDIPRWRWFFAERPEEHYEFHAEPGTPTTVAIDAADVVTLRAEEGFHLNHKERNQLSELLEQHADIFGRIVEATPFAEHTIKVTDDSPIAFPPYRLSSSRKAAPKLKYLGHVITADGISVDPEKIQAICSRPAPKDVKGLLSWLQTGSWFRRFIPNFAQVVQPLTILTRKNTRWTRGSAQQEAFDTLKQLLTSTPILRTVDDTLPFRLKTDASAYALGACLLQEEGSEERPI